ncbi:hypothetical protein C5167_002223, partial [Papaver somniferum]
NMESDQSSNPQTGRTTWTPPMDRLFIGLMEDQVQKGQLLDGQFSKYAWTHFVDNFKQSFGSSFTKDITRNLQIPLKNRMRMDINIRMRTCVHLTLKKGLELQQVHIRYRNMASSDDEEDLVVVVQHKQH